MDGVVKWFSKERGYGFIYVSNVGDHYFHVSDVTGASLPHDGDLVTFVPTTGRDGKLAASQIEIRTQSRTETTQNDIPYYGHAEYATNTTFTQSAPFGTRAVGAIVGGFVALVVSAFLFDSVVVALISGGVGFWLGEKIVGGGRPVTETIEITETCLKCGGQGQVTAQVGAYTGFQCRTCKRFWKTRRQ